MLGYVDCQVGRCVAALESPVCLACAGHESKRGSATGVWDGLVCLLHICALVLTPARFSRDWVWASSQGVVG